MYADRLGAEEGRRGGFFAPFFSPIPVFQNRRDPF